MVPARGTALCCAGPLTMRYRLRRRLQKRYFARGHDTYQTIHSVLSTTKYGEVLMNLLGRLTISARATQEVALIALFRQHDAAPAE